MKKRNWTAEEKFIIVMEGLKEVKSIAEICREHQISQTLYYQWRDKFLESGKDGLAGKKSQETAYKAEIKRLQNLVGKQAFVIETLKKPKKCSGKNEHGKRLSWRRIHFEGILPVCGSVPKPLLRDSKAG